MKLFSVSPRKHRWVKVILSISLVAGLVFFWADYQLRKFAYLLESRGFTQYVSELYIPNKRRDSGKWPTTLDGLPQFVKSDKDYTVTDDRLNRVLRYYNERFYRMEIVKVSRKDFVYRLYTKEWVAACRSTVNPDGGDCWDVIQ